MVAARALAALVADGRIRELVIRKVDGEDVAASPFRERLLDAGFVAGYRGLVLRVAADGHLSARGRHALPDRGRTAAVPRRAGTVTAARTDGPGAGPAGRTASSATRSPPSRRSARTC